MAKTKLQVAKKAAAQKAAAQKAAPKKAAPKKAAPKRAAPEKAVPKKAAAQKAAPKKAAPKKAAPKRAAPKKAAPKKKASAKLVKILLHNQGEDPETPFAEDLGPAAGHKTRRVRLANVPFLHAKPTYGDVVIVAPDPDGFLSWDRAGVDFEQIGTRIEEDGGRYAMIVDYLPRTRKQADVNTVFRLLRVGAEDADIVPEGCFGPDKDRPGRLYLAVPEELQPAEVMKRLAATEAKCVLTLVHPES